VVHFSGHLGEVAQSAPRIDSRIVAAIARADDRKRPMAETYRQVAALAEELGLTRPSYEQVRALIHLIRARKRDPGIGQVLLDST
jgi:hypothetical protein